MKFLFLILVSILLWHSTPLNGAEIGDELYSAVGMYNITIIEFNKHGALKEPPDYVLSEIYKRKISRLSQENKIMFLTAVWLISPDMDAGLSSCFIGIINDSKLKDILLTYWKSITKNPSANPIFKEKILKGIKFIEKTESLQ